VAELLLGSVLASFYRLLLVSSLECGAIAEGRIPRGMPMPVILLS
jgi:hypothetical protein